MKENSGQMDFKALLKWILLTSILALAALFQYPLLNSSIGGSRALSLIGAQLCFIPVALAALAYGTIGGLVAAAAFSLSVVIAFIFEQEHFQPIQAVIAEIIGFIALAIIVGWVRKSYRGKTSSPEIAESKENDSNNVQAVEGLAKIIANDLKNPLNVIKSAAEKIEHYDSDDKLAQALKDLSKGVEQLEGIAEDYLDFAAPKVTYTNHVDISSIVESIVAQMRPQAERMGVRLALSNDKADGFTRGDEKRLGKLLINILINGIQAAEGGGQVEVKCHHDKSSGVFLVEISDTGSGVKGEAMNRIFEPFYSTRQRGSGLGLAIAKAIAEEHNGGISVANIPSSGAKFTIRLPIDDRVITEY